MCATTTHSPYKVTYSVPIIMTENKNGSCCRRVGVCEIGWVMQLWYKVFALGLRVFPPLPFSFTYNLPWGVQAIKVYIDYWFLFKLLVWWCFYSCHNCVLVTNGILLQIMVVMIESKLCNPLLYCMWRTSLPLQQRVI